MADDFLASREDLAALLAQLGTGERRQSSRRRNDEETARAALSHLFPGGLALNAPPAAPAPRPVPRPVASSAAPGANQNQYHRGRREYCKCGTCKWCLDNARWDRIFTEKFADRDYYSGPIIRHSSALADVR